MLALRRGRYHEFRVLPDGVRYGDRASAAPPCGLHKELMKAGGLYAGFMGMREKP
jgi:hypothetical protein